ncbi:MAG: site-specific DNA-methyltransferase, partial [Chloroflexi bacterium]|nr:site-specific DNA-methyltransferase [Chloroflexota bacterium]
MTDKTVEYVTKTTPDVGREQIERLKQIFPECVSEGKVDFDLLRATLGDADALADENAYTFTWAGKQDAFRAIQTPSAASLAPAPEESVNWESTQHLFIEGENLEVLKLLYKSYYGRVKMIYIDPPYNTGHDFIYRDDYRQPRRAYLEKTGQIDAEGNVLTSNPETSGRYHSDWLTMMYPRLFLARQLLREDGVIFVSIDDHEVHNLRLLMNEIFGEENFIAQLVWLNKEGGGGSDSTLFRIKHEYLLTFARDIESVEIKGVEITNVDRYRYKDKHFESRGPYYLQKLNQASIQYSSSLDYEITAPDGEKLLPRQRNKRACWRWSKSKVEWGIENNFVVFKKNSEGKWQVYTKQYLQVDNEDNPIKRTNRPMGVIADYSTTQASKSLFELFGAKTFEYSKPSELVEHLIKITTEEDDLVLDFFAGSGTVAEAVLRYDQEDGVNRRFTLVQLPEPTPEDSPARQEGYETISEIGKERIRRVIAQMQAEREGQLPLETRETPEDGPRDTGLGFKVFKLAPSTFRHWQPPQDADPDALEQQLALFDGGLEPDADP